MMNADGRLQRARSLLVLDQPFYGTLAMKMANVLDPGVETTETDGRTIRWNPDYLAGLSDEEVRAVMAHDVMHAANGHGWRRGARDAEQWNASCDKAVNGVLVESGFKLPAGQIMPAPHESGLAAEMLYAAAQQQQSGGGGSGGNKPQQNQPGGGGGGQKPTPGNQNAKGGGGRAGTPPPGQTPGSGRQNGKGNGPGNQPGAGTPGGGGNDPQNAPGCGKVTDPADGDDAKELEAEWTVAVAQAAEAARSAGALPAGLERMVKNIVDPKVHWETLLRDFVERTARNDYNWTRPNRRYIGAGIVLPTLVSEELPTIVLAVDTSGSVGPNELAQFEAEASAVLGAYETTIHVVFCDAKVAGTQTVTRADMPLNLKHKGGGGTDFRPPFEWVKREDITPAALIYLTDGATFHPWPAEPDYPVLWIMTTDVKAPWGETVKMN